MKIQKAVPLVRFVKYSCVQCSDLVSMADLSRSQDRLNPRSRSCLFTDLTEVAWPVAWVQEREGWIILCEKNYVQCLAEPVQPVVTTWDPANSLHPVLPLFSLLESTNSHYLPLRQVELLFRLVKLPNPAKNTAFVVRFIFLLVPSLHILSMESRQDHCHVREGRLRGPNRRLLIRMIPSIILG